MLASEKAFETKVKAFLENKSWLLKTWSNGVQRFGIPDLIICYNGFFIGAELKKDDGVPTELQLYNLSEITKNGGYGFLLVPTEKGVRHLTLYIDKYFPEYFNIRIIDFDRFVKLIGFLEKEESINKRIII